MSHANFTNYNTLRPQPLSAQRVVLSKEPRSEHGSVVVESLKDSEQSKILPSTVTDDIGDCVNGLNFTFAKLTYFPPNEFNAKTLLSWSKGIMTSLASPALALKAFRPPDPNDDFFAPPSTTIDLPLISTVVLKPDILILDYQLSRGFLSTKFLSSNYRPMQFSNLAYNPSLIAQAEAIVQSSLSPFAVVYWDQGLGTIDSDGQDLIEKLQDVVSRFESVEKVFIISDWIHVPSPMTEIDKTNYNKIDDDFKSDDFFSGKKRTRESFLTTGLNTNLAIEILNKIAIELPTLSLTSLALEMEKAAIPMSKDSGMVNILNKLIASSAEIFFAATPLTKMAEESGLNFEEATIEQIVRARKERRLKFWSTGEDLEMRQGENWNLVTYFDS